MTDRPALAVRHAVRASLALVWRQRVARTTASPHTADASRSPLVLVALSGGADSLALLAATVAEAVAAGVRVGAVVVDHGLQPGSAEVAGRAAVTATALGADPVELVRVVVSGGGGPEASARAARYAALDEAATRLGVAVVLLGHTRDDQAETVLLGLARGSGARSLSGMAAELDRGGVRYLRPLLGVDRATTRAACAELGLEPWDDPHNEDPAFTRVRVRTELLPLLTDVLGPGSVAALARSADLLRDDADALDAWAAAEYAGLDDLDAARLAQLPSAVRRRVLRLAALDAGSPAGSLTAAHLDALDALVARWHGQGEVALPGPVLAGRSCGRLAFRDHEGHPRER